LLINLQFTTSSYPEYIYCVTYKACVNAYIHEALEMKEILYFTVSSFGSKTQGISEVTQIQRNSAICLSSCQFSYFHLHLITDFDLLKFCYINSIKFELLMCSIAQWKWFSKWLRFISQRMFFSEGPQCGQVKQGSTST
jgi:hypothetical protein